MSLDWRIVCMETITNQLCPEGRPSRKVSDSGGLGKVKCVFVSIVQPALQLSRWASANMSANNGLLEEMERVLEGSGVSGQGDNPAPSNYCQRCSLIWASPPALLQTATTVSPSYRQHSALVWGNAKFEPFGNGVLSERWYDAVTCVFRLGKTIKCLP